MALTAGTKLGPYEILSALGAGGMGEVYKARDTRLERAVAIKVLPESLAADPQFRERFDREARAISQLTHPHICTLYDIGHEVLRRPVPDMREGAGPRASGMGVAPHASEEGIDFLVLEYLEGETLAARLEKGALPLDQALTIAIQIASALDKAHRVGITHRDLKPGNIMLTKTGAVRQGSPQAKLLDFGLAKTGAPVVAGTALSMLPTTPPNLTAQGTILGTFQYMAPEQIEGQEADARTDLFAFGVVLYEMLTGQKAFTGKTQASLIGAILEREPPPVSTLQPLTPRVLDRIVKKCLAKDPDERWQSAKDLHDELSWIAEADTTTSSVTATPAGALPRVTRERLPWLIVAALLVVSIALGAMAFGRKAPDQAAKVSFDIAPPSSPNPFHLTVSPDGKYMSAVVASDKGNLIWLRALAGLSAQTVNGSEDAQFPFWSPDNRFLGFFAGGKLKKVDLSGTAPQTLCDADQGHGGTWNRDGVIVFAPSQTGPLFRVSGSGGVPVQLTELDASRQETAHRHPYFLTDGEHFLFAAVSSKAENSGVYIGSLNSKERKRILGSSLKAAFVSPDHVLFVRTPGGATNNPGGALMAQQFDAKRLEVVGDPVPIVEEVGGNFGNSAAGFAVSDGGVLAYRLGNLARALRWYDRSGKPIGTVDASGAWESAVVSPDVQRLAVLKRERTAGNLWLLDQARGMSTRFTFDPVVDDAPVWSPDGSRIVFSSSRAGPSDLYQKNSAGTGQEEVLLKSDHPKIPDDWSADGRFVLYRDLAPKTGSDLWVLPMMGDKRPQPVLNTPFNEIQGRFSPDGRWIAYVSNESGAYQVYVQSFPPSGGKWQVSIGGGFQPRWRRDGKELFFMSRNSAPGGDDNAMAVAVDASNAGAFRAGVPQKLFAVFPHAFTATRNSWDVTPDGQRFLVVSNSARATGAVAPPVTVVLNWLQGLDAKTR